MAIDWIIVKDATNKEIGAVGFIGDKATVITSFYEGADGNMDGKVSMGEWVASKVFPINVAGMGVARVAYAARQEADIQMRDSAFNQMSANILAKFAAGLVTDGVYSVYFSRGVAKIAKGIAGRVATKFVMQFAIRKGMEKAVKEAYKSGVGA